MHHVIASLSLFSFISKCANIQSVYSIRDGREEEFRNMESEGERQKWQEIKRGHKSLILGRDKRGKGKRAS